MNAVDVRTRPPLSGALALLEASGLPSSDLSEQHLEHFLFLGQADSPTALVGLEIFGRDALLRSLAVSPGLRNAGLGSALVERAEEYARARGVSTLYLLTTTAREFFEKRGYRATSRESCPETIRSTAEFTRLCPASSAFLRKRL